MLAIGRVVTAVRVGDKRLRPMAVLVLADRVGVKRLVTDWPCSGFRSCRRQARRSPLPCSIAGGVGIQRIVSRSPCFRAGGRGV